jgi:D-sedoheptulose 7-phosphate isomerase
MTFSSSHIMTTINDSILSHFQSNIICLENFTDQFHLIEKIIEKLISARDNGNMIFIMGNGGSGSTASHFVSDLLKTAITKDTKRFKAISLVDNIPVNLAWSNDVSFDTIFSEQLHNFLKKDDVVICFSGSGNSQNIINAVKYGKECGSTCLGITGMSGGKLSDLADISLIVPSQDMLLIESTHLLICHCIVSAIREQGTPKFNYG